MRYEGVYGVGVSRWWVYALGQCGVGLVTIWEVEGGLPQVCVCWGGVGGVSRVSFGSVGGLDNAGR